jgi:hypothetical protein
MPGYPFMIVSTVPVMMPLMIRRSPSTAITLYFSLNRLVSLRFTEYFDAGFQVFEVQMSRCKVVEVTGLANVVGVSAQEPPSSNALTVE